jgi:hypothetical protein
MSDISIGGHARMSLLHAVAVGAAVLGFLFILLWASDASGIAPATHRFVEIFAGSGEGPPIAALERGLPLALAMGALAGALLAVFSNLFRSLAR